MLVQENWVPDWTDPLSTQVGNILLSRVMGAEVRLDPAGFDIGFRDSWKQAIEDVEKRGGTPYAIPAGASDHRLGGLGFAHWAYEVAEQEQELGVFFDTIVVCTVTGSTHAGMIAGFAALEEAGGRPRRVLGIDASATLEKTREQVARIARNTAELIGLGRDLRDDEITVLEGWAGDLYGVPVQSTLDAIRLTGQLEGVILDTVYEGKSMAGLIDLVRNGEIAPDSTVLYAHLGGQPALNAYASLFPTTERVGQGAVVWHTFRDKAALTAAAPAPHVRHTARRGIRRRAGAAGSPGGSRSGRGSSRCCWSRCWCRPPDGGCGPTAGRWVAWSRWWAPRSRWWWSCPTGGCRSRRAAGCSSRSSYDGHAATAQPIELAVPQHPGLAPNGRSSMHDDGWATDAYAGPGPLGRDPEVDSSWYGLEECATLAFDSRDRIVALCGNRSGPVMHVLDPDSMRPVETFELPDREKSDKRPWEDLCGGAYFYLDPEDRAVVATTDRRILTIDSDGLRQVDEVDLGDVVPDDDCLVALHAGLGGQHLVRHPGRPGRRRGRHRRPDAARPRRRDRQLDRGGRRPASTS